MRISDLKAFVILADTGKFYLAAEQLNISQPALTRRLQKLEELLNLQLFDRTTRQVNLTPPGRDFLTYARQIVIDTENAVYHIQDQLDIHGGIIKLACLPSIAMRLLPKIMDEFTSTYPKVRLHALDGNMTDVVSNVYRSLVDFGIGMMLYQQPELYFSPLFQERLGVVCHSQHPLAKEKMITKEDLSRFPLVSNPKQSGNRLILQMELRAKGVNPNWFHEAQSLMSVLSLITSGKAIAILPESVTDGLHQTAFTFLPIYDLDLTREIGLVYKKDSLFPTYTEFLIDLIKNKSVNYLNK